MLWNCANTFTGAAVGTGDVVFDAVFEPNSELPVGERAGVVGAVLTADSAGLFPNREPPDAPNPVVDALVVDAGAPNGVGVVAVAVLAPNRLVVAPTGLAAPKADGAAADTGGWAAFAPNKLGAAAGMGG